VPGRERSTAPARAGGDHTPQAEGDLEPLRLIERFLAQEAMLVDDRRRALAAATEAVGLLRARVGSAPSTRPVEPVAEELVAGVVSRLLHETTGMTRSFVMAVDEGPALDDSAMRDNRERIAAGLVQRAIYPVAVLGTPSGLRWVQSWGAIGEEQRVVAGATTEFAVFDSAAVVALARWGEMSSGYVMSRERVVVDAFAAYFDLAWDHALPVPTAVEDAEADRRLVELLGRGLKDEAIARYLGIGLRTVRRRVARLMAVHGVETRFQLGAAVERAGRRPPPGR